MSNILPGLKTLIIPLKEVTPDPGNARRHTPEGIDNLKHSLTALGQHKPIVVQKTGMICRAGNGLLQAATELGWTEIAAVVVDEDNVTAVIRALQDNKSSEVGSVWNQETLAEILTELNNMEAVDFAATGFTTEELNALSINETPTPTETTDTLDVISEAVRTDIIINVPSPEAAEVERMIRDLMEQEQVSDYRISTK